MMSFDMKTLPQRFSERLPRRAFAAMFILVGAFLSLAWLGRIIPPLMQNGSPPLENVTSLFIQAMDLGMIVPLCFLSAVLLLRRNAFGYLLASISVMKFLTMGLAVSVMGINMVRAGVPASPVELVIFPAITLANGIMAVILLRNIDRKQELHNEP
jgi:hypothetical protein